MAQPTAAIKNNTFGPSEGSSVAYPMDAAAVIWEGSAVSLNNANGYARQLNTGDTFTGFATRTSNNSVNWVNGNVLPPTSGLVGAQTCPVIERGKVQLSVATGGVLAGSVADVGLAVYATDGQTFTGSNGGGALLICYIDQFFSGTNYVVNFFCKQRKQA
jgi:hypothetical protein